MGEQGYMKCNDDPPLKPCHVCGAEINANWTIRGLQKEIAELEEAADIEHNRIKSLKADAQEAAKSYRFQVRRGDGWQKECIKGVQK